MIEAKVVLSSIGPTGVRLTTFVLTYPRFIHSEFMTHRMISRNASSSRAIPVKKQIEMVLMNPAVPLAFTKNQKGMRGGAALEDAAHNAAIAAWIEGRDRAVEIANKLADLEVHKQYANRVLEPYAHITVVATATDWDNFFALRIHPAAQPEIHALAKAMYAEYERCPVQRLEAGQWHLPFVRREEIAACESDYPIKMSVARCARVSYLNHEGKEPTLAEDLQLYDRLLGGVPIHASPAEHQGMARSSEWQVYRSGNFKGWIQYRKMLHNENIEQYNP